MSGSPTCGYFGKGAPGELLSERRPIIFVMVQKRVGLSIALKVEKQTNVKSPRLNVWQKEPKTWIQSNPIKAAVKLMFAIVLVVSSGKLSKLQILPQRRKLLVKGKRGLRGNLGNPLQFVCFHVVANILKLAG